MVKLSVIIPTYNEEDYLEDALKSVGFADEIIVVDSLSTDKTVALAERYGCTVLSRKFDNFSNQKNHAIRHATGEWILFLDADERITHSLKLQIKQAIHQDEYSGYKLNFPHFFMNRFLYHHDDDVLRLVKRKGVSFKGLVHEKLNVNGKISKLNAPVLHYTYKGIRHYISKKDSYAWFQAEQLLKKGKKATYFHLAFKPFYRFFSSYILRGGILDGVAGLAIASINAYGVFSRYAKLLLLQKQMNS